MDFAQLLPWAIFGGITVLLMAAFGHFSSSQSRAAERLEELRDPSRRNKDNGLQEKQKGMGAILEKAAPTLSKALQPKTELEQSELKVSLASTRITTGDLVHLRVGDVITTEKDVRSPLLVTVEGIPKFRAAPGAYKAHKAIRIEEVLAAPADAIGD